ncbi:hypothetical protein RBB79_09060 [Tunturiibacter empetritectus]|uniref:Uncharacterized protein n=1 Tax=Tunturiibacter lichenicola TaxID=2051959 RepID=A0A852VJR3_9BACT|nr:hypothetical protein [Edaphobacter lichenicola]NYF89692.1 hypothetical protein [Edaphobacter lichenicola]
MTVVVFAMLFVVLALGIVILLMARAHKHAVQHNRVDAGTETHGRI